MGRKNRRNANEYRQRLGFNPDKYIKHSKYSKCSKHSKHTEHTKGKDIPRKCCRNTYPVSRYKPERPYRVPYRGEIWIAQLGSHPNTSVQEGCRPVLIVSNDKGNHTSNTVVVLPLTSQIKRSELPSHVELHREDLFCFGPEGTGSGFYGAGGANNDYIKERTGASDWKNSERRKTAGDRHSADR